MLLEEESDIWRTVYPDVHVVEYPRPSSPAAEAETAVAIEEEPVLITPQSEPLTEGYIEIVDAESGNRVITVIEFLVPRTNCPAGDATNIFAKATRRDSGRGEPRGNRFDPFRPTDRWPWNRDWIPADCRTTYQICVWRSIPPGRFEIYRAPLMPACRRSAFRCEQPTPTCDWIFSRW